MFATFALGTALGDFTATSLNLGYLDSGILFGVIILIPALARWRGINFGGGPTAIVFAVAVFVLVCYLAIAKPDIQEPLAQEPLAARNGSLSLLFAHVCRLR